MISILLGLYFLAFLLTWPVLSRKVYSSAYDSPAEAIGLALILSLVWPVTLLGFFCGWLFGKILPKLFRIYDAK